MKPIPITVARDIAERYDYDQIVIIGRKVGHDGGEQVTTYGKDEANCDVAARIGDFIMLAFASIAADEARERAR